MGWGKCSRGETHGSFFCWEEDNRDCAGGGMEKDGKWGEWSQHSHVSSALQLRCWETQSNSKYHVLWSLFILLLQSVFLEQVWRVCVSRSCCSVQLKCNRELLGEVHVYDDSSMYLQLCFVKDKCTGNFVIHEIMAISRTGSQDCWSWTLTSKYVFLSSLRFLPCRRICVMVWEEKIKRENEGNETSPYKILPSIFSWGGIQETSTWEVRDICSERREGNIAASRSFYVSQLSAESSGCSCTSIWVEGESAAKPGRQRHPGS